MVALDGVDLSIMPGEVLVLMGRNGSGKSTLLNTLSGMRRPTRGSAVVDGAGPPVLPRRLIWSVMWGWCPRTRGSFSTARASTPSAARPTRCQRCLRGRPCVTLERVLPGVPPDRHPRDLSEGQRLALALAIVVAPAPALLLLDEPTRGLDYPSKDRLIRVLRELAA